MNNTVPACRTIAVCTFRGDRSRAFAASFKRALADEKRGRGPGPGSLDCLIFAGHTGVSEDSGTTIYGFHPDGAGVPVWQLLHGLKSGSAFPGVVRDDTAVFAAAQSRGLVVLLFEVVLPDPQFQKFEGSLDGQRRRSQYLYGFPNGDGDCNCITWLERLGLPLLTGRMNEFLGLRGISSDPSRRFGRCV